jgi:hypothetical protein
MSWNLVILEAPVEGSVLSFLKAEWKVSDTGSAQLSAEPLVFNFTHKGRKYLTIIEHIMMYKSFKCFSCLNLWSKTYFSEK